MHYMEDRRDRIVRLEPLAIRRNTPLNLRDLQSWAQENLTCASALNNKPLRSQSRQDTQKILISLILTVNSSMLKAGTVHFINAPW